MEPMFHVGSNTSGDARYMRLGALVSEQRSMSAENNNTGRGCDDKGAGRRQQRQRSGATSKTMAASKPSESRKVDSAPTIISSSNNNNNNSNNHDNGDLVSSKSKRPGRPPRKTTSASHNGSSTNAHNQSGATTIVSHQEPMNLSRDEQLIKQSYDTRRAALAAAGSAQFADGAPRIRSLPAAVGEQFAVLRMEEHQLHQEQQRRQQFAHLAAQTLPMPFLFPHQHQHLAHPTQHQHQNQNPHHHQQQPYDSQQPAIAYLRPNECHYRASADELELASSLEAAARHHNHRHHQQVLQFASLHSLSAVASALQKQQLQQQHQTSKVFSSQVVGPSVQQTSGQQLHVRQSRSAPSSSVRRRTERKCRKMYGMEQRNLWCTQCKWKKACSRFCDRRGHSVAATAAVAAAAITAELLSR